MNEISLKINIKFLTWYSQFHAIHVNSIWVQLKSYLRKWRQSRDRKCHQSCAMSGSMFCASATGSCAISALVGPLDRKWQSRDRKRSWPEVCSAHARLFPPAFFFLVVVQLYHGYRMWPKITWPPSGFSWVCACTTGSCATPVMTEGHVTPLEVSMGCSLRRPRPITIGNPASYI